MTIAEANRRIEVLTAMLAEFVMIGDIDMARVYATEIALVRDSRLTSDELLATLAA